MSYKKAILSIFIFIFCIRSTHLFSADLIHLEKSLTDAYNSYDHSIDFANDVYSLHINAQLYSKIFNSTVVDYNDQTSAYLESKAEKKCAIAQFNAQEAYAKLTKAYALASQARSNQ